MKNLTIEHIAHCCSGAILGGAIPPGEITAVNTDSRAIEAGSLFVAIRGERVDGHDFVSAAFQKGAACALVEHIPPEFNEKKACLILVPHTLTALQQIARMYRDGFDLPLIGVTGSVGKTTAKEMIAHVLSRRFRVHKTSGNFNNDLGVPLTLFGLREDHTAAVVELGVSHPGDMARIAAIARPTMALYTLIGHAHLEFLKSRDGIFQEKTTLNRYLPPNGVVLCNGDDDLLAAMVCPQRKLTFGFGENCLVRASHVQTLPEGVTACRIHYDGRDFPITIPAYGEHMVYAALSGAAAGYALGLTDEEIADGIADYVPVGRRARMLHTGTLTVIDDCYNANPTSTLSALRSLSAAPGPGRKICVLGDMLELGEQSETLHQEVGRAAKDLGINLVLTYGNEAAAIAQGAEGISRHFDDRQELLDALPSLLQTGDIVLVKASRSMRFEEVTAALERI